MREFRWILLGLGILLLLGIWWWGARRSRQAPGDAQLRESTAAPIAPAVLSSVPPVDAAAQSVGWGVPPFEPLSIRTAEFDEVPHIDLSMTTHSEPFDDTLDLSISQPPTTVHVAIAPAAPAPVPPRLASARAAPAAVPVAKVSAAPIPAPPALENSDRLASSESEEANTNEKQRIVSIRVCAPAEEAWAGTELMAVLEDLGLAHGRYQVFHRKQSDGRTLFCAASLREPGTFDLARMPEEEFFGLTLFAVLPGPAEPLQIIDALLSTADDLAQALQGTVQITKGVPLSDEDVATLREDVARFQASMTG